MKSNSVPKNQWLGWETLPDRDHCAGTPQQDNSTPVVSLLSARTQGCLLPWFPLRPSRRKEVWDQGTRIRSPTVKETPRSRWAIRTAARTRSPRPSPTTSTTATGSSGPNRTPTLSCWHPDLRSSRPPRVIHHTGEDLENLAGRGGIFVMYSQTVVGNWTQEQSRLLTNVLFFICLTLHWLRYVSFSFYL